MAAIAEALRVRLAFLYLSLREERRIINLRSRAAQL